MTKPAPTTSAAKTSTGTSAANPPARIDRIELMIPMKTVPNISRNTANTATPMMRPTGDAEGIRPDAFSCFT